MYGTRAFSTIRVISIKAGTRMCQARSSHGCPRELHTSGHKPFCDYNNTMHVWSNNHSAHSVWAITTTMYSFVNWLAFDLTEQTASLCTQPSPLACLNITSLPDPRILALAHIYIYIYIYIYIFSHLLAHSLANPSTQSLINFLYRSLYYPTFKPIVTVANSILPKISHWLNKTRYNLRFAWRKLNTMK